MKKNQNPHFNKINHIFLSRPYLGENLSLLRRKAKKSQYWILKNCLITFSKKCDGKARQRDTFVSCPPPAPYFRAAWKSHYFRFFHYFPFFHHFRSSNTTSCLDIIYGHCSRPCCYCLYLCRGGVAPPCWISATDIWQGPLLVKTVV